MKIVITGATGLVGQTLLPELRRQHEVITMGRDGFKDLPAIARQGIDGVIHLAGENVASERWTKARKQALRDSRLKTAASLAEAFQSYPLQFYISASGIGYYGDRGDAVLTESDAAGQDFLARLCVDWEQAADQMPAARKVKLRFGLVLKQDSGFLGRVVPIFKKLGASRLGSGQQWMSWIHVDDVVQVILQAIANPKYEGAINVVAPQAVTNAQMTESIRKILGAWPGPPVPSLALRLLYGELSEALLFSQRAKPGKLEAYGYPFIYPVLDGALRKSLLGK